MRHNTLMSGAPSRELWFNVYFGVYGSGEPHYSPAFTSRNSAEVNVFRVGYLAYRIRVIPKIPKELRS